MATENRDDLESENLSLQRMLEEQRTVGTQDQLQVQRQLDQYEDALDSTYAVAIDAIEWAANQSSRYAFDELPLGDERLSIVSELSDRLLELGFQGLVRIETHVGNFCMTFSAPGSYVLAGAELPAVQCDRLGYDPSEAYELGLRQSVAFANFINLAGERTGGRIRYEIISLGNSSPLMSYPAAATGLSASQWNEIAASNQRVDIAVYPLSGATRPR